MTPGPDITVGAAPVLNTKTHGHCFCVKSGRCQQALHTVAQIALTFTEQTLCVLYMYFILCCRYFCKFPESKAVN